MKNSFSESYKNAGVDVTAGYKAVELMKEHVKRTKTLGCCFRHRWFWWSICS